MTTPKIINGRFPLPLVWQVRFNCQGLGLTQVARLFATTPGKVQDIRRNSSYKYINERFKPSQEMVNDTLDRLDLCSNIWVDNQDNIELFESLKKEISETCVMTKEEESDFNFLKNSTRKKRVSKVS